MAINNKVGEATIEVTAVDNSGPVIDRAVAQAQAAASRANTEPAGFDRSVDPAAGVWGAKRRRMEQEHELELWFIEQKREAEQQAAALSIEANRRAREVRNQADREAAVFLANQIKAENAAQMARLGHLNDTSNAQAKVNYNTVRYADSISTTTQQLKAGRQAAFGMLGQLTGIVGTAVGMYSLGAAIRTQVETALESGTQKAKDFSASITEIGGKGKLDKLQGEISRLEGVLGQNLAGGFQAAINQINGNSTQQVQDQLDELRAEANIVRQSVNAAGKKERDSKKAETVKDNADKNKKIAEQDAETLDRTRREYDEAVQRSFKDEEDAAAFAFERSQEDRLAQREAFLRRGKTTEAAYITSIIDIERETFERKRDEMREARKKKDIQAAREVANAIQQIYDAAANSATASAGFDPVVAELKTVSAELKRIRENTATSASYAGLSGEPS